MLLPTCTHPDGVEWITFKGKQENEETQEKISNTLFITSTLNLSPVPFCPLLLASAASALDDSYFPEELDSMTLHTPASLA